MQRRVSYINNFLHKVKNHSKSEILAAIEKELQIAAYYIQENKHNYEGREFKEMMKYYRYLKSFRYLLLHAEKDLILRDKEYKRFEWICEKLIKKGELEENIRKLFI